MKCIKHGLARGVHALLASLLPDERNSERDVRHCEDEEHRVFMCKGRAEIYLQQELDDVARRPQKKDR